MVEILREDVYKGGDPTRPWVVAYYTVDTPYEGEAEVLKLSLESVGYNYVVCAVPNQGSWQKNTQLKAQFILQMMDKDPLWPMLYLDVDAVMVQAPVLLDGIDADIAAVHFAKGNELLSGTVFFGNTPACHKVVVEWMRNNARYPETLPNGRQAWDQRTLEMAIRATRCKFVELPQEYTWITELTQKIAPGLSPVIMHTRGAKRFKNQIDGKKGYAK